VPELPTERIREVLGGDHAWMTAPEIARELGVKDQPLVDGLLGFMNESGMVRSRTEARGTTFGLAPRTD